MSTPIVINLFAGPGAGKSTGAAYVFSQLKMRGINCEYISEYAKDKTWEGNGVALSCQEYIFGKQSYRQFRCKDQVDVIITDSPLILGWFYNSNPVLDDNFKNTVLNVFNSYNNMNYFIERDKPYNPIGRNQTEEESKEIDNKVTAFLTEENISFKSVPGNESGYSVIVYDTLMALSKENKNGN